MISIEKRFFTQNSRFFWTFAIEYETDKKGGTKDIELETDVQKGLFLALKEWRNELAAEKGIPPYLVFTNNQLKQIAVKQPKDFVCWAHSLAVEPILSPCFLFPPLCLGLTPGRAFPTHQP